LYFKGSYNKRYGVGKLKMSFLCDVCGKNIETSKSRYHCHACEDFDLCEGCYELKACFGSHKSEHPIQKITTQNISSM
jgi:hypothetical protein